MIAGSSPHDPPVAESTPAAGAGCAAALDSAGAGCVQASSDEGQAVAPPQDSSEGAGCAAQAPADASDTQAAPPTTVRQFEHALRGLGFTRHAAAEISRHGFARGIAAPEAPTAAAPADDTQQRALADALERLRASLKD